MTSVSHFSLLQWMRTPYPQQCSDEARVALLPVVLGNLQKIFSFLLIHLFSQGTVCLWHSDKANWVTNSLKSSRAEKMSVAAELALTDTFCHGIWMSPCLPADDSISPPLMSVLQKASILKLFMLCFSISFSVLAKHSWISFAFSVNFRCICVKMTQEILYNKEKE